MLFSAQDIPACYQVFNTGHFSLFSRFSEQDIPACVVSRTPQQKTYNPLHCVRPRPILLAPSCCLWYSSQIVVCKFVTEMLNNSFPPRISTSQRGCPAKYLLFIEAWSLLWNVHPHSKFFGGNLKERQSVCGNQGFVTRQWLSLWAYPVASHQLYDRSCHRHRRGDNKKMSESWEHENLKIYIQNSKIKMA